MAAGDDAADGPACAQLLHQIPTRAVGQLQIANQQINGMVLAERETGLAVVGGNDIPAFPLQPAFDGVAAVVVVLDQ